MPMSRLVVCQMGILIIIVISFVTCSLMIFQGLSLEGFMGYFAVLLFVPKLPRVILNRNQLIDAPYRPLNRYECMLKNVSIGFLAVLVSLKVLHYFLA